MSTEENKTIVRRLTDGFNAQDLSLIDDLVDVDYIDHGPFKGQVPGREGMKQAHALFYAGFPDIYETIEDIFAEGDKVVVRWTCRGTHLGKFAGIRPTNKRVTVTGIDIYRIVDGRVAENWHNIDGIGMLQQIGLLPALWAGEWFAWALRKVAHFSMQPFHRTGRGKHAATVTGNSDQA